MAMPGIPYVFENLGKKDPLYNGILTDISTLPEGTAFYVRNGDWYGRIVIKNGKKSVEISEHKFTQSGSQRSIVRVVPVYPDGDTDNILALSDVRRPE